MVTGKVYQLLEEALDVLQKYHEEILDAGVMPSPSCLTVEQHESLFILNYPGGSRLNRTIGMISYCNVNC